MAVIYCKRCLETTGRKRRSISAAWQLCGQCWKATEGQYVEKPPPPPVAVYEIPVSDSSAIANMNRRAKTANSPLTLDDFPMRYRPIPNHLYPPDEGILPYDWHNEKLLTWKEFSLMLTAIWHHPNGETVMELAHRYNVLPSQIIDILKLPEGWPTGRRLVPKIIHPRQNDVGF